PHDAETDVVLLYGISPPDPEGVLGGTRHELGLVLLGLRFESALDIVDDEPGDDRRGSRRERDAGATTTPPPPQKHGPVHRREAELRGGGRVSVLRQHDDLRAFALDVLRTRMPGQEHRATGGREQKSGYCAVQPSHVASLTKLDELACGCHVRACGRA